MINNLPSLARVHQLLKKQQRSVQENQQLVLAIKKGNYDMPDVNFSITYDLLKKNKNNSDQRYINLEQLILNAIKIKIPYTTITKYIQHFAKFIGKTKYLQKIKALSILYKNNQNNDGPLRQISKEDQSDLQTKKKLLTQHKRQGKYDQYIREMKKFLQNNPSDTEAWIQLSQIYAEKGLYLRALFCMQQVVVIHPQNEHYMVKLAELYITHGGKQNIKAAIKYYSHVISRCPNNIRALWGLHRVLQSQKDKIQAEHVQLKQLCKQTLNSLYSKKNDKIKIHVAF